MKTIRIQFVETQLGEDFIELSTENTVDTTTEKPKEDTVVTEETMDTTTEEGSSDTTTTKSNCDVVCSKVDILIK